MNIHELLDRDPRHARLANDGQARIADTDDAKAQAELRDELEAFVCDGKFGEALERILGSYLTNLQTTRQQSAWVSGFFGSGKSHLLKMLTHLWRNTTFDDGATARSLIPGGLPKELQAHLQELETQTKRTRMPAIAAAGTMLSSTVDQVRQAVLAIVLRACGWPSQYPHAMFCFWLREEGLLDDIRTAVEDSGRDWNSELNNLYVSPVIAQALMQARPDFADNVKDARKLLTSQYPPQKEDITTEQFTVAVRKALSQGDEIPHTIVVLDEVQQYISDVQDRATLITEVAESLQTEFNGRIMLICAGQSALSSTPMLRWLRDRFQISVELSDADVEAVTRKVLLRKKPSANDALDQLFEDYAGETDRHLQGTNLRPRPEDRATRKEDYPLLPVRRRFWEVCFRVVDSPGTYSQLRSQLRILSDSLTDIAEKKVGAVIPASDIYNALAPSLVNMGTLSNEINTRIQKLDDGSPAGKLRRDICGMVFLIGKLSHEPASDLGVRANADIIADLLVEDITISSGPFRNQLAAHLTNLVDEGVLMQVGSEYRIQTREGAEWDREFRERQSNLTRSEVEINAWRTSLFTEALQEIISDVRLNHGDCKQRRTLTLHTTTEPPNDDTINIWLRDEWNCKEREFENGAHDLKDPTIHVYLHKEHTDALKRYIINAAAANQVLSMHNSVVSREAQEARQSMKSRLGSAEQARTRVIQELCQSARVLQGGGNEISALGLKEKIRTAAMDSLARLYPRFKDGDHRAWAVAVKRAKDGSGEPFKAVEWQGTTEGHPVAREVLQKVNPAMRGSTLHKDLKAPPYGWPQDAIDAALIALHRSGHLRVTHNGRSIPVGALDQTAIKSAEFKPEKVHITATQHIALRSLFGDAGVATRSGEEEQKAPQFLDHLLALADEAGGKAPLPKHPDTAHIQSLKQLTGNEQLAAIFDQRSELEKNIRYWQDLSELAQTRRPGWEQLTSLCNHATDLPILNEIAPEMDAIRNQRSLLESLDHQGPLQAKVTRALREELSARHQKLTAAIQEAMASLAQDVTWRQIKKGEQDQIQKNTNLNLPQKLNIETDTDLLSTLSETPLSSWQAQIDAVGERTTQALEEASSLIPKTSIQPTTVTIRRGTLANAEEVRTWLDEHETKITEAARKGPVIIR